jgi:hypothetical protein
MSSRSIVDAILERVLGAIPILVVPTEPTAESRIQLDDSIELDLSEPGPLQALLATYPRPPTVVTAIFPGRSRPRNPRAFETVLQSVPADIPLAFWVPSGCVEGLDGTFREVLLRARPPAWIVWLRLTDVGVPGAHPGLSSVLVVCAPAGQAPVLRLVDLEGLDDAAALAAVDTCRVRGGGEGPAFIVVRDATLDSRPWIFRRFSRRTTEMLDDLRELGHLARLGDLVDFVVPGPARSPSGQPLPERASEEPFTGSIPRYSGASIGRDGVLGEPSAFVPEETLAERARLQEGDLLVARVVAAPGRLRVARVPASALPAAAHSTTLVLRPTAALPDSQLLAGYLRSERVSTFLQARGGSPYLRLFPAELAELIVPVPGPEIAAALDALRDSQQALLDCAAQIGAKRERLFAAESYAEAIPSLLEAARVAADQTEAARFAITFDFLVRERFPHPIALRREQLLQLPHGSDRLAQTLECAEHFVAYLALVALCDRTALGLGSVAELLSSMSGMLALDFGKTIGLLDNMVARYRKHPNALLLGFPELASLAPLNADRSSDWHIALSGMQKVRNDHAHLHRLPADDQQRASRLASAHLDSILRRCDFLTATPLVHVLDYGLHSLSGERHAEFAYLTGVSTAFRRERRRVQEEVPREAVGVLDRRGRFRSLAPLIVRRPCETCRHAETFIFNRLRDDVVTFVAMETGHPHDDPALAAPVRRALGAAT